MRQLLTKLRQLLPQGTPMSTATTLSENPNAKASSIPDWDNVKPKAKPVAEKKDSASKKPLIHSDIFFPETVEAHDPNPPANIPPTKQKSIDISHDEIAIRAYYIWQNTGNEDAFGNWIQAFQQLVEENLAVDAPALLAYKE